MRKKRISSTELNWLIQEALGTNGQSRVALAVVSDPKFGWRVVVGKRSELLPSIKSRLSAIEGKLRKAYDLDE
jgi:hypothetical protein